MAEGAFRGRKAIECTTELYVLSGLGDTRRLASVAARSHHPDVLPDRFRQSEASPKMTSCTPFSVIRDRIGEGMIFAEG